MRRAPLRVEFSAAWPIAWPAVSPARSPTSGRSIDSIRSTPASARGEDNQVEKLRHVLHSARIEHPTGAEIPRRVRPDSPGEYLAKNYDDTYAERFAVEFAVRLKCFAHRSVFV